MNTVLEFINKGGIMMWPLLFLSVILVMFGIERAIVLKKASIDGDDLLDEIKSKFSPGGDPTAAKTASTGGYFCESSRYD